MIKANDATKLKEYNITLYSKGFISSITLNNMIISEIIQYRQIYNIIHHPNIGVEIVFNNKKRRVFYNDTNIENTFFFDALNRGILVWLTLKSN
jgi:hypothetical protein